MRGEGTKLGEGDFGIFMFKVSGLLRSGLLRSGMLRSGLLRTGNLRSAVHGPVI